MSDRQIGLFSSFFPIAFLPFHSFLSTPFGEFDSLLDLDNLLLEEFSATSESTLDIVDVVFHHSFNGLAGIVGSEKSLLDTVSGVVVVGANDIGLN